MKRTPALMLAALLASFMLTACEDSTHDILSKADAATTKAELEEALGPPDVVSKVGPLESWIYRASNGEVSFFLAGDAVTIRAASTSAKK